MSAIGVTAYYVPLPWTMADDKSHWRAELPDGRTAFIQRVAGEDGLGSIMFVPRLHESPENCTSGPACPGVLPAALWIAGFLAARQ